LRALAPARHGTVTVRQRPCRNLAKVLIYRRGLVIYGEAGAVAAAADVGMRWTVAGADAISALRCQQANRPEDQIWTQTATRQAPPDPPNPLNDLDQLQN